MSHSTDDYKLDPDRPLHEQEAELDWEDFQRREANREPTFLERMAVKFRNFLLGENNEL
jgi:hypothetical protein